MLSFVCQYVVVIHISCSLRFSFYTDSRSRLWAYYECEFPIIRKLLANSRKTARFMKKREKIFFFIVELKKWKVLLYCLFWCKLFDCTVLVASVSQQFKSDNCILTCEIGMKNQFICRFPPFFFLKEICFCAKKYDKQMRTPTHISRITNKRRNELTKEKKRNEYYEGGFFS